MGILVSLSQRHGSDLATIQYFSRELGGYSYPEQNAPLDITTLPEGITTKYTGAWKVLGMMEYEKTWPIEHISKELRKARKDWNPHSGTRKHSDLSNDSQHSDSPGDPESLDDSESSGSSEASSDSSSSDDSAASRGSTPAGDSGDSGSSAASRDSRTSSDSGDSDVEFLFAFSGRS